MQLTDVSIETLSVITAYLHYLDVSNLWLSGSRRLNAKFANGGVSELTILFNDHLGRFSWPSFLCELPRLQRFLVENWNSASDMLPITPTLLSTWSTMKVLTLRCRGAFPSLQSLLDADPHTLSALESLEVYIWAGDHPDKHAGALWPQNLTRLALRTRSGGYLVLELSSLPPHLTTLDAEFYEILNGTFPASLTELRLGFVRLPSDLAPLLPAGLKSIIVYTTISWSGEFDFDEEIEPTEWAERLLPNLPRGLTSLSLELETFSRDVLKALPETLTTLNSLSNAHLSPEDYDVLPRSLAYCSDITAPLSPIIDLYQCFQLPRGLKRLRVRPRALPHVNPSETSNAEILVVDPYPLSNKGLLEEMSNMELRTLPIGIKALNFPTTDGLPCEILPQTLTSLTLATGALSLAQISALPNTLLSLVLTVGEWREDVEVSWRMLPKRLEILHLYKVPVLPIESASWLPTTLQDLRIEEGGQITQNWLKGLPNGIRYLHLPLDFTAVNDPMPAFPCPPTLVHLSIQGKFPLDEAQACKVLQNIIVALPPLMDWLCIRSQPRILFPASILLLLPRRLTHLEMPGTESGSWNRHLLPRSLLTASLGPTSCSFLLCRS